MPFCWNIMPWAIIVFQDVIKSLLVMIMNYQEDYFEKNKWELETRQTVQVRCVILDME